MSLLLHLDESLERVQRVREQVFSDSDAPDRAARLAALFELEAEVWSQMFESSSLRLVWRAALAAEALARHNARVWRQRAVGSADPREARPPARTRRTTGIRAVSRHAVASVGANEHAIARTSSGEVREPWTASGF